MNSFFPKEVTTAVKLDKLFKASEKKTFLSERMSSRMVKCASALSEGGYIGWQLTVPKKGLVGMTTFGTHEVCRSDLEWITEKAAKTKNCSLLHGTINESFSELYELYIPASERGCENPGIGFGASASHSGKGFSKWPAHYAAQFRELVRVLQSTGGILRVAVGYAGEEEQLNCLNSAVRTYDVSTIAFRDYAGHPVRTRVLLRLPNSPSVRLRTVIEEAVRGAKIRHIGRMDEPGTDSIWDHPIIDAPVLPDYAARIMILEPEIYEPVTGIELIEEEMKKIPAGHKNAADEKAVVIGRAVDAAGTRRRITVGEVDLKRHYQIVGQTGTGKSTLLTTLILSAIEKGYGLTFFDPHGSTIDMILRTVPEEHADRIRVVRIGDAENPVPLNIWDSDDPVREERNINDLCELFGDIFNPPGQVFVGPRYERWLSTFAKASIAFLGRRASLESISVLSQSQDNMLKLSKAIISEYPELVETIKEEYGLDKSNDWHQTLSWFLCKFQRLTSVEQLRKTLGAGTNALDFPHTIDTDMVTLIDLASPAIGTHASRIVGTLLLMKLWNAVLARKERDKTHLVVVDEASLFQTNPMPRMLAESRKFGISMVLCHQHTSQLFAEIRDALEANSANFSAFRLSPRDAVHAAMRFDDPEMQTLLARLDAFHAVTTLSVNGKQTAPFTMETIKPKLQKNAEEIAGYIEAMSIATLVDPYRELAALTPADILYLLNNPDKREKTHPDWLDKWARCRSKIKKIS